MISGKDRIFVGFFAIPKGGLIADGAYRPDYGDFIPSLASPAERPALP